MKKFCFVLYEAGNLSFRIYEMYDMKNGRVKPTDMPSFTFF